MNALVYITEALLWLFGAFLLMYFLSLIRRPLVQKSHWQQSFDSYRFSAEKFYDQVKAGIKEREIPGVQFDEETFVQKHLFSARRRYLRISWNEYVFYVNASPFGTGSFASWHLCIKEENLLNRIPLVSKLMGSQRDMKTFYQKDTEAMYRSVVHTVVTSVVEGLTVEKGRRELTASEKHIQEA